LTAARSLKPFRVAEVYLKKEERIEALSMIMALSLLIYSIAEWRSQISYRLEFGSTAEIYTIGILIISGRLPLNVLIVSLSTSEFQNSNLFSDHDRLGKLRTK
jgi:hypothetical protein